ncbi:MAG TPA: porin, partial [Burkholderiales bacterium]|nr:porin [Burkholderiales bacterium]
MVSLRKGIHIGAMAGVLAFSGPARSDGEIDRLKEQLQELDQRIRILQRQQELDKEAEAARARETPTVSTGKEGFWLRSADKAYQIRIGGIIQFDSHWYPDKTAPIGGTADTFAMRKVRPVLEGTFLQNIGFRLMPDFGNGSTSIQDAYVELRLDKAYTIRAGKFKPPIGLERLQLDSETEFVERGLPTNLAPNRDTGLQVGGSVLSDALSYQAGVFNGNPDNSVTDGDTNDQKDVLGRVFAEPFSNGDGWLGGLGIGIAFGYGVQQGTAAAPNLASYKTVGQQNFFVFDSGAFADGGRTKVAPQFYYYRGPFGLLGEYIDSSQEVSRGSHRKRAFDSSAWQLNAYWVLTGEDASFRNPTPRKPYAGSVPGWGAVELALRYGKQSIGASAFEGGAGTRLA